MKSLQHIKGAPRILAAPFITALLVLPCARASAAPPATALGWDADRQGHFVVSQARDALGRLWVGTEDQGVSCYDPQAHKWKQFTAKDGLGDDNAYAITGDALGRVWVGTLNHGVSVFNGQAWKTYGVLEGPPGERIFALATSPTDGDVWMATSGGLARYSVSRGTWTSFVHTGKAFEVAAKEPPASDLPSNQANALAFDTFGNLYVGTQCDGIAIAHPDDNYASWQTVRAPQDLPPAPGGEGLPSNLINDILVARDGTIYAATDSGLARSHDAGDNWTYLRGSDWRDKASKMPPPVATDGIKNPNGLLAEDYVTRLAEDDKGLLWIGYRLKGYEARDAKRDRTLLRTTSPAKADAGSNSRSEQLPYVSAILTRRGAMPLIGSYGDGLLAAESAQASPPGTPADNTSPTEQAAAPQLPLRAAPFPRSLQAPTLPQLNAMLGELGKVPSFQDEDTQLPNVIALDEDWRTQGDWRGRYGRYWMDLMALCSPENYEWGGGPEAIYHDLRIGPNSAKGDWLRHWIHWLQTDNPRSLEMPTIYMNFCVEQKWTTPQLYRRQSEVDDHGEKYPLKLDGPHVYCTLQVPEGLFTLSLYDFNKDGHDGDNRLRDYTVSIRPHDLKAPLEDISRFKAQPEISRSRIQNFWGGLYKRFLVYGPAELTVEINRNYSHNTLLAAATLDLVDEEPLPYFHTRDEWKRITTEQEAKRQTVASEAQAPEQHTARFKAGATEAEAASRLFDGLERMRFWNAAWWATRGRSFYRPLLLWLQQAQASTKPEDTRQLWARLGTCCYQLGLYGDWEAYQKRLGKRTARDIELSLPYSVTTEDTSGKGFEFITRYLASAPAKPKP